MIPKHKRLGKSTYYRYQSSFLHQFALGSYFLQFIVWFKPPLGGEPIREWFLYSYRTGKLVAKGKVFWKSNAVKVQWGKVNPNLTKRIYNASFEMWYPNKGD